MCGFAGYWSSRGDVHRDAVLAMAETLRHRGPDHGGIWLDQGAGLALAHRRLVVLELSSAGNQPMISPSGRYVIAYNGEIYNHQDIRNELEKMGRAPDWRGRSDTETLLAALDQWNLEDVLARCTGMFAFALWDRRDARLILARDRMGEKPLYYGMQGDTLLFASELKALKTHPSFRGEIDRNALALLMRYNCIPAPHSIYRGIAKLMPGQYLSVSLARGGGEPSLYPKYWWRYNDLVEGGAACPFEGSDAEALDELEAQLSASVGRQMLSDVPLGALLSGGIDSTAVVSLMQARSRRPVQTFTIGTHSGENEAVQARAVARHLGTDHQELYVSPDDALAIIPQLPALYCEPFSDSSQVPTFLVCQLAGRHVKVALSGDGGDEVFCGYNRYLTARRFWQAASGLPFPLRRAAAAALRTLPPDRWDGLFAAMRPLLPRRARITMPGYKAQRLAEVLTLNDDYAFYRQLVSHWHDPGDMVIDGREPSTVLTDPSAWPRTERFEEWMMAMDAQTYMTDDILVKVDRAAMANSLEVRVPLLDHSVVAFAWRLPFHQKVRNGQGKWILRQLVNRYVPEELVERPKAGFAVPIDAWLRGPLRDWAGAFLDEARLRREGFFRSEPIARAWRDHLSGRRNEAHRLWDVLMFQAWLEAERSGGFPGGANSSAALQRLNEGVTGQVGQGYEDIHG